MIMILGEGDGRRAEKKKKKELDSFHVALFFVLSSSSSLLLFLPFFLSFSFLLSPFPLSLFFLSFSLCAMSVKALSPSLKQLGNAARTIVIRGKFTEESLPKISAHFAQLGKVLNVEFSRVSGLRKLFIHIKDEGCRDAFGFGSLIVFAFGIVCVL